MLRALISTVVFLLVFIQLYACGVKQQTLRVTSASAMKFCFYAENGETEIRIGDDAVLVYNENGIAGCEEFAK